VPVLTERGKGDGLAWRLYKDGIRELRFLPGVERDELVRFLEIVRRGRVGDEDDVVTQLWENDFSCIGYRAVDLAADGDGGETPGLPGAGVAADRDAAVRTAQAETRASAAEPDRRRSTVINMADFDSTLHFLDEREIEYLQTE